MESDADLPLATRLNRETARIAWGELERPFARGAALHVRRGEDLVAVACAFAADDAAAVRSWRRAGAVRPVSDDEARRWLATETVVWAVVVAPFVLVQPADGKD